MTEYLRFREQFAAALDPRFHPIEYLDQMVADGSALVWASETAALVCEVRDYPGGARAIQVLVAAGDKAEIVGPLRDQAEEWARSVGCTDAIVESRPGWARALKHHGYEPHQQAVRKGL